MFRPSATHRTIMDVLNDGEDEGAGARAEEVPEHEQVHLKHGVDGERFTMCGISYTRCGGGFRIDRRGRRS